MTSTEASLQIVTASVTAYSAWKMGDLCLWGPTLALVAQGCWAVYIYGTGQWWLLIAFGALSVLHVRTFYRWRHDEKVGWGRPWPQWTWRRQKETRHGQEEEVDARSGQGQDRCR